jgi:hypothetical protein
MKERPILMSAPMVRALLREKDPKTQTRRMAKLNAAGRVYRGGRNWHVDDPNAIEACPYGVPGERLWVKEAWRVVGWNEGCSLLIEYADGARREETASDWDADLGIYVDWRERMLMQCSEDCEKAGCAIGEDDCYVLPDGKPVTRWRPSIHMPRWASRIALEVVSRRLEPLHNISEADVLAEGVAGRFGTDEVEGDPAICVFEELWDSINGDGAFAANPRVWVMEFKRIDEAKAQNGGE